MGNRNVKIARIIFTHKIFNRLLATIVISRRKEGTVGIGITVTNVEKSWADAQCAANNSLVDTSKKAYEIP